MTRLAPMQQQDRPQTFELDEPVLCIGGRLKVRQRLLPWNALLSDWQMARKCRSFLPCSRLSMPGHTCHPMRALSCIVSTPIPGNL